MKKAELYKIGYEEQPDPRDRILSVSKVDDDHLAQAVRCFHTSKLILLTIPFFVSAAAQLCAPVTVMDQLLSMLRVSLKAGSI